MAKIAFLGLGQMGTPMASRLLEAGHDVTVWNRTPERSAPLGEQGAVVASTPAEAGAGVDFATTMLATPDALQQVVFGAEGLARALGPGQTLVDMSTVGPDAVKAIRDRLPDGVSMVDAPVRGSVSEATEGRLVVYVRAADVDFDRVRPILQVLGELRHVGGPGSGAAIKLVVNSTLGASIAAFGEALALGKALGLERDTLLDALEETTIGSVARSKRESVESGRYPARFQLGLMAKDMGLVAHAADEGGRDLKVARAAQAWFEEATQQGDAALDYSAVVATILGEDARA